MLCHFPRKHFAGVGDKVIVSALPSGSPELALDSICLCPGAGKAIVPVPRALGGASGRDQAVPPRAAAAGAGGGRGAEQRQRVRQRRERGWCTSPAGPQLGALGSWGWAPSGELGLRLGTVMGAVSPARAPTCRPRCPEDDVSCGSAEEHLPPPHYPAGSVCFPSRRA